VYKVSPSWIHVLIFTSSYLEPWHDTISSWIRLRNSIFFFCKSRKSTTETLVMIIQAFGVESLSRTRKVQIHRDWSKGHSYILRVTVFTGFLAKEKNYTFRTEAVHGPSRVEEIPLLNFLKKILKFSEEHNWPIRNINVITCSSLKSNLLPSRL
jgi:hypothetical protein